VNGTPWFAGTTAVSEWTTDRWFRVIAGLVTIDFIFGVKTFLALTSNPDFHPGKLPSRKFLQEFALHCAKALGMAGIIFLVVQIAIPLGHALVFSCALAIIVSDFLARRKCGST
jgi:hypothetical protein